MIIDTLTNAATYYPLHPLFEKAFAFLCDPKTATLEPGRYELQGTELYAMIQNYPTRTPENCALEAHRKYIDIQFLISGNESIGYTPLSSDLTETKPYVTDSDIVFYQGIGEPIPFKPDTFFILYPQDAHAPGIQTTPQTVKKVVIKVAL